MEGPPSLRPRQHLLQLGEEVAPTHLGAPIGLLLIRAEALLLHPQMRACARRGERPGDSALEPVSGPAIGERLRRLDLEDLAVDRAPVAAKA